jgi:hypothetical protein
LSQKITGLFFVFLGFFLVKKKPVLINFKGHHQGLNLSKISKINRHNLAKKGFFTPTPKGSVKGQKALRASNLIKSWGYFFVGNWLADKSLFLSYSIRFFKALFLYKA